MAAVVLSGMAAMAAAEEPTALPGAFNIPFKHDLLGAHPRLLYSKEDMARWAKAGQDDEKFIWDAGDAYFKACAATRPDRRRAVEQGRRPGSRSAGGTA